MSLPEPAPRRGNARPFVPPLVTALALSAALACGGCGLRALREAPIAAEGGPSLRILLDSAAEARLTSDGDLIAEDASGGSRTYSSGVLALPRAGAILLVDLASGEERPCGAEVLILSADGSPIRVGKKPYRGSISLAPIGAKSICIVNHVATEDYLLGVVPVEIGRLPESDLEAVKAQAVAARTYALSSLGQYPGAGFDLNSTAQDQVYVGAGNEDSIATRAVLETAGLVLESRDALARAYYSSTCGGRTAAVAEVWVKPPASYLRGGADRSTRRGGGDAFCSASPYFSWKEEWSGSELDEILARNLPGAVGLEAGAPVGHLTGIKALTRGRSGRVLDLEVQTTVGSWIVSGDAIRFVLRRPGTSEAILRSTLFRVEHVEKRGGRVRQLILSGRGYGHGVGMCQTGAIRMAEFGYTFREILRHYYRGAKVKPFRDVHGIPVAVSTRDVVRRILVWTSASAAADSVAVARR